MQGLWHRNRKRQREVAALRRELRGIALPCELRRQARELRRLRLELARLLGSARCCARCGVGKPLPHGRWPGGFCCGAETSQLFTRDELAALRGAGTRPADLRPARGPAAGCAFRGPRGCVLPVAHRPSLCVAHICRELARELHQRQQLRAAETLAAALYAARHEFAADLERHELDLLLGAC